VTLSRRISRQAGVRITVALLFVASAGAALLVLALLDASPAATIGVPLLVALSAVPIALARTRTMHERWFHLLPLVITVEAGIAMWAIVPDPGAIVVVLAFNGAMTVFLISSIRGVAAQLLFASAVMLGPVVAGESTLPSTLTIIATIGVMWGYAVMTFTIWSYAEDAASRLDALAQRDALTGVGNRRLLDERLDYELVRHVRTGEPLALVVLDLNGFKEINDRLGHAAGDDVLRDVARAIVGAVRAQDTVARPGGDEFCIIAPDTDAAGATVLVEHIRAAISGVMVEQRPLRAGIGWAVAPSHGQRPRELFEAADAAQREDKPDGRGRAALASAG
jgi:diguanylate cyclase (GGDEF)-like protein